VLFINHLITYIERKIEQLVYLLAIGLQLKNITR